MSLIDRVRRTISRHDLAGPDTRLLAALSGGPDSMALTHLLRELQAAGELRLIGLAHFNHKLRAAADDDEAFCRGVAESLGLPLVVEREDVASRARREGRSMEDAARTARHAFFDRARVRLGADAVALGHTLDDQAETYSLRLIRGAGPRGLAAMHPRRGAAIRPLLDCRREDLRQYLLDRQLPFVHDTSNDDVTIPRNRVRAELLPMLEQRFNRSIARRLADQAELAREEWLWMSAEADALASRIGRREGARWCVGVAGLLEAPRALARLLLQEVMTAAAGGRTVAFSHVERAIDLARRLGPAFDAPGQRVELVDAELVFESRPEGTVGRWHPLPAPFHHILAIPGEVALPELGRMVCVEEADSAGEARRLAPTADVAIVRKEGVQLLAVRNRRTGDRFRPGGLGGTKKLQDFFVDRKIARRQRDTVPLVVDQSDRIIWVAGHAVDDQFRVTDPAQAVLILRLKVLGGSA